MAVAVNLEKDKVAKKGLVGFSWTTFFFGFFVPLIRGDLKWTGIMFLIEMLVVLPGTMVNINDGLDVLLRVMIGSLIASLIYRLVLGFIYNKHYTENLLNKGFRPVGDSDAATLKSAGLYNE